MTIPMVTQEASSSSIAIIVPVYNEAGHVGEVLDRILQVRGDEAWEVIAVNDGATDGTDEVLSRYAGRIRVVTHLSNCGYGASLKSGIHSTRAKNVIFLDADGQHDPAYIPEIVQRLERYEFVIGIRRNQEGVPFIRRPGKMVLKLVVSFLVGKTVTDVNYGFRGGRRKQYLRMLDLLPDGFSFSTTSLVYVLKSRFATTYLEIPSTVRKGISTVRIVRDGLNTLLLSLRLIMLFDPMRAFAYPALGLILLGVLYQLYIFATFRLTIVGGALLMVLSGFLLFFLGLLGDQIASLRKEISSFNYLIWEENQTLEAPDHDVR
jgi:glycosyltransferase involved in cell wall biosynthesis